MANAKLINLDKIELIGNKSIRDNLISHFPVVLPNGTTPTNKVRNLGIILTRAITTLPKSSQCANLLMSYHGLIKSLQASVFQYCT